MLSIQYYPVGCQNGQQNRQHSSPRIARSAIPMLSVHAVHFALQSSFQAQYSTTHRGQGSCYNPSCYKPCACLGRVKFLSKPSIPFPVLSVFPITCGICSSLDGKPQWSFSE